MIDSHCHLDFPQFDRDRSEIIEKSRSQGVSRILLPGTQAHRWQPLLTLAEAHPQLSIALGLHPYFLHQSKPEELALLDELLSAKHQCVVAVGEIGLDFAIEHDSDKQQHFFEAQLDLAAAHQLPVVVHHRRSHNQIIRTLKRKRVAKGGVIHAFSGSLQEAMSYVEMGFLLGVGGTITYPRARKTRDTISQLPLKAILLETDAPDMPLNGFQGQRNSPTQIPLILDSLTAIRAETRAEIEHQTDANFTRLFLTG